MTENTMTIEFPAYRKGEFDSIFGKISRKIVKVKGLKPLTILSTEDFAIERTFDSLFDGKQVEKIPFIKVTIEAPFGKVLKKQGFQFVGTISCNEGSWAIYNPNGEKGVVKIAEEIVAKNGKIVCFHCGSARFRNSYQIFKSEKGLVAIGSTCCREYFGFDLVRALNIWNGFLDHDINEVKEVKEPGEYLGGGRGYVGYSLERLITATKVAFAEDSSWKKSNDYDEGSTSGTIYYAMSNLDKYATKWRQDIEMTNRYKALPAVDAIKEKVVELFKGIDRGTDFGFNIYQAMFTENGELKMSFSRVGLSGWAIFKAISEIVNPTKEVDLSESDWIGKVGEKIEIELVINKLKSCYSDFGSSMLVSGVSKGNVVSMFSTASWVYNVAIGQVVKINGTIKKLGEFKGVKQTTLTRVKMLG